MNSLVSKGNGNFPETKTCILPTKEKLILPINFDLKDIPFNFL